MTTSKTRVLINKLQILDNSKRCSKVCETLPTKDDDELKLLNCIVNKLLNVDYKLREIKKDNMVVHVGLVKGKMVFEISGECRDEKNAKDTKESKVEITDDGDVIIGLSRKVDFEDDAPSIQVDDEEVKITKFGDIVYNGIPSDYQSSMRVISLLLEKEWSKEERERLILFLNNRCSGATIEEECSKLYESQTMYDIFKDDTIPEIPEMEFDYAKARYIDECYPKTIIKVLDESILFMMPMLHVKELMQDEPDDNKLKAIADKTKEYLNICAEEAIKFYFEGDFDFMANETLGGNGICDLAYKLEKVKSAIELMEDSWLSYCFKFKRLSSSYYVMQDTFCRICKSLWDKIKFQKTTIKDIEGKDNIEEIYNNANEVLYSIFCGERIVKDVDEDCHGNIDFSLNRELAKKCKNLKPRNAAMPA